MVVWLFAGGGESEVLALVPLLKKHFTCRFERKTPVRRKPGPKPRQQGYGKTGKSLERQIQKQLHAALERNEHCHLILVIDDLDCRDAEKQKQRFHTAINEVTGAENIPTCVGFAAPEIEAWLIADWDNTLAHDVDFRKNHEAMRWWLSHEKHVPFDSPETFSHYDAEKQACADKLSVAMQEAARIKGETYYAKGTHTPRLLLNVSPAIIRQKCPLFRELWDYLQDFCEA